MYKRWLILDFYLFALHKLEHIICFFHLVLFLGLKIKLA